MSIFRLRTSPAVLIVATVPMWLSLMDTTILNIGYGNIVSSLGATLDEVSWASTAYTLAAITTLPLAGWLVARYGRKRVFLTILFLFTAGSMLCALATTATQLGLFRLLQGFGGGLLGTVSQAIFLDAYPDEHRREAFNLLSVTVMVGPFLGP
ncbi:MAG TPA: MFS transporter, partial [Candidatus Rubrimentiphilum sp.]|nr:MFS transporter [Candidatus Rubrimentiphilum sp.]